jgi:hypothetical protein
VTSEENYEMTKQFQEEIKRAIFQMEKKKATGPDGMPVEFYQTCWEFIKDDISDLFSNFYVGSLDIKKAKLWNYHPTAQS